MGEEQPEAKDRLGKNVKDGIGNNFSVDGRNAGSISNTPDADRFSNSSSISCIRNLHRINGPEDQGEACDGNEKCGGFLILALNNTTSIDGKLVDDDQVSKAAHGIPSPFRALVDGNGSEEASQHHDDVSDDSDEDVGTT